MAEIATHKSVDDMAPELQPLLATLLGARHVIDQRSAPTWDETGVDEDSSLVWERDYQPIFTRDRRGGLEALLYLSPNPNRSAWHGLLQGRDIPSQTLPIIHENGNLVIVGRYALLTDRLFEDNAEWLDLPHLRERGYRPRSRAALVGLLAQALHRSEDEILILPQMPLEETGHVDVFVLPLDDETVALPEIPDDAIAMIDEGPVKETARRVRDFLDERAEELRSRGLQVVRMPMIAPAQARYEDDGEGALLVFTPANSLLANVGGRRLALYPAFHGIADDPRLIAMLARHAVAWERTFRSFGWDPYPVDASELVGYLGLCRCVTAPLPE
jgi:hypothetical protein